MNAGELRSWITIEKPITTKDTVGNPVNQWVEIWSGWSKIEPLSGRALEVAQQLDETISHKVSMWWEPGISSKMRVNYEGRYLNIVVPLNPLERDIELWLMCEEASR